MCIFYMFFFLKITMEKIDRLENGLLFSLSLKIEERTATAGNEEVEEEKKLR